MRVSKLIKEDWPMVLPVTVGILALTTFLNKSTIEYKGYLNKRIKFVCVAMCGLVMSLHSRDLPINNKLLTYNTLIKSHSA